MNNNEIFAIQESFFNNQHFEDVFPYLFGRNLALILFSLLSIFGILQFDSDQTCRAAEVFNPYIIAILVIEIAGRVMMIFLYFISFAKTQILLEVHILDQKLEEAEFLIFVLFIPIILVFLKIMEGSCPIEMYIFYIVFFFFAYCLWRLYCNPSTLTFHFNGDYF